MALLVILKYGYRLEKYALDLSTDHICPYRKVQSATQIQGYGLRAVSLVAAMVYGEATLKPEIIFSLE